MKWGSTSTTLLKILTLNLTVLGNESFMQTQRTHGNHLLQERASFDDDDDSDDDSDDDDD